MTAAVEQIVSQALALSPPVRALLAEKLIESLDVSAGSELSSGVHSELCRAVYGPCPPKAVLGPTFTSGSKRRVRAIVRPVYGPPACSKSQSAECTLSSEWREEVRRRCEEIDQGTAQLRDAEAVFAQAYAKLT